MVNYNFFIGANIINITIQNELTYTNSSKERGLFELKHMASVHIICLKGFSLILSVKKMNQAQVISKNEVSSTAGTTGYCYILEII